MFVTKSRAIDELSDEAMIGYYRAKTEVYDAWIRFMTLTAWIFAAFTWLAAIYLIFD